ncbi:MAG: V-type ATPase subunit [Candidatus Brocadiales bacterium]|nr:V-type ATPase subunit [Candidatus Brocadiales bacterium]
MEKSAPEQWCFISGKVSVLENNLLRKDFFHRLLASEKPEDLLVCLRESPLREHFNTIQDLYPFEDIINLHYFHHLWELRQLAPSPEVCDLFQLRFDLINLKNFLKKKIAGISPPAPFPSPMGEKTLEELWLGRDTSLPQVYKEAVATLRVYIKEATEDVSLVDLILDGAYLSSLAWVAEKISSFLIKDYLLEYQRLRGILILGRALKLAKRDIMRFLPREEILERLAPLPLEEWKRPILETLPEKTVENIFAGAKKDLFTRYERHTEDYLMDRLEPARYVTFGPERVFGYLSGLTTEVFNLRLTLGGVLNKLGKDALRERLRKTYV